MTAVFLCCRVRRRAFSHPHSCSPPQASSSSQLRRRNRRRCFVFWLLRLCFFSGTIPHAPLPFRISLDGILRRGATERCYVATTTLQELKLSVAREISANDVLSLWGTGGAFGLRDELLEPSGSDNHRKGCYPAAPLWAGVSRCRWVGGFRC